MRLTRLLTHTAALSALLLPSLAKGTVGAVAVQGMVSLSCVANGQSFSNGLIYVDGKKMGACPKATFSLSYETHNIEIRTTEGNQTKKLWSTTAKISSAASRLTANIGVASTSPLPSANASKMTPQEETEGMKRFWEIAPHYVINAGGGNINFVSFSFDDTLLAAGSDKNEIFIYNIKERKISRKITFPDGKYIRKIAFSPTGYLIGAISHNSKNIYIWDARTGELTKTFSGHSELLTDFSFSLDGKKLISSSADRNVRVWDLKSGELLTNIYLPGLGRYGLTKRVILNGDGTKFAAGAWRTVDEKSEGLVIIGDAENGEIISSYKANEDATNVLENIPGKMKFVSGGKGSAVVWDWDKSAPICNINVPSYITNIVPNPNGKNVAIGEGYIDTIIMSTSDCINIKIGNQKGSLDFNPQGELFAGQSDTDSVGLMKISAYSENGNELPVKFIGSKSTSYESFSKILFSHSGNLLVSTSYLPSIRIWPANLLSLKKSDELWKAIQSSSDYIAAAAFVDAFPKSKYNSEALRLLSTPEGQQYLGSRTSDYALRDSRMKTQQEEAKAIAEANAKAVAAEKARIAAQSSTSTSSSSGQGWSFTLEQESKSSSETRFGLTARNSSGSHRYAQIQVFKVNNGYEVSSSPLLGRCYLDNNGSGTCNLRLSSLGSPYVNSVEEAIQVFVNGFKGDVSRMGS